jgi:hypothetical protein
MDFIKSQSARASPKNIVSYSLLKLGAFELLGACENDITVGACSHPKFFVVKTQCLIACRRIYSSDFEANLGYLRSLFIQGYQCLASSFSQLRFLGHVPSLTVMGLWDRSQSDKDPLGT